jgi:hypothetical protein
MIVLRTNLDQVIIPADYNSPYLPPLGATIVCRLNGKPVRLEVRAVTYVNENWEVELHIPTVLGMSIRDWYQQYGVYI